MRAVIYLRVSTKEQADKDLTEEGFSIPAQREACVKHICELGWELADEYIDMGESARSIDRPQLKSMLTRVAENSDIDVVVVHKVDRLARNLEDHVAIRSLLTRHSVKLASVSENLEESPSGRLVEGIHAIMAEFYSANLATEIKKGMGQKAKMGGYPHKAPLGYLNVRESIGGRELARIIVDPKRGHLVAAAFELYASGQWTLRRLIDELAHRGLTIRSRRDYPEKPLTVSGLAKLLSNKSYIGIVTWDGVEYPGTHEALVEPQTFAKVQELLVARGSRGTRERRHHHYLKGLLYCGVCDRRLSIQLSKGQYTYFYCLGQKDRRYPTGCRESYVSAGDLEAGIEDLYKGVQVPKSWAAGLTEAIAAEVGSRSQSSAAEKVALESRRQCAEAERMKLMTAYYAGAIDVSMLKSEQDRIGRELVFVNERLGGLDAKLEVWQDVMNRALDFSTSCSRTSRRAGERSRKQLNSAVFEKVLVRDGKVAEAEYRQPFDLLFSEPKFEYEPLVEVSGLEPPTPTLRTSIPASR